MAYDKQNLAAVVRHISGTDYDNLAVGEKIEVFTDISKIVYKTIIKDLIKEISDAGFSNFVVEKTSFGNGYRVLSVGVADVEEFTTDPRARYPQTRNLLPDWEQIITDKGQLKVRITLNDAETSFYFQNIETMGSFLSQCRKRVMDTLKLVFQDTILRIFGDGTWMFRTIDKDSSYVALVDKIRSSMKNNIKAKSNSIKDTVQWMMLFLQNVTSVTTKTFNIGWDRQDQDFRKALNTVGLDDLVLVMSNEDYVKFNTEIQAQVYNNQYFAFPKIKIMNLPIKSGTMFLLDKNAIQISPNRSATFTEFFANTLDIDHIHHEWFYAGLYGNAFGVKIDFETNGKEVSEYFENTETNPLSLKEKAVKMLKK